MYKLTIIDKTLVIIVVMFVVFFAVIIIVQSTKLIDSYIIANEQLSTQQTVNFEQPEIITIDCETELREGDMISARQYDPFGEWQAISQDNMQYQLEHGGRLIQCK